VKEDAFLAFRAEIEAGVEACKSKRKGGKSMKQQQTQVHNQREWSRALKRTQCYLGLRPRRSDPVNPQA